VSVSVSAVARHYKNAVSVVKMWTVTSLCGPISVWSSGLTTSTYKFVTRTSLRL